MTNLLQLTILVRKMESNPTNLEEGKISSKAFLLHISPGGWMAGSGSVPLIPDLQILDPKVEDRRFHSFQISRQFLGGPRIAVNTFKLRNFEIPQYQNLT